MVSDGTLERPTKRVLRPTAGLLPRASVLPPFLPDSAAVPSVPFVPTCADVPPKVKAVPWFREPRGRGVRVHRRRRRLDPWSASSFGDSVVTRSWQDFFEVAWRRGPASVTSPLDLFVGSPWPRRFHRCRLRWLYICGLPLCRLQLRRNTRRELRREFVAAAAAAAAFRVAFWFVVSVLLSLVWWCRATSSSLGIHGVLGRPDDVFKCVGAMRYYDQCCRVSQQASSVSGLSAGGLHRMRAHSDPILSWIILLNNIVYLSFFFFF